MPDLTFYDGVVQRVKNEYVPSNLKESILSELISAKKQRKETLQFLLDLAEKKADLAEAEKKFFEEKRQLKEGIQAGKNKLKVLQAALLEKQREIDAIPLPVEDEKSFEHLLLIDEKDPYESKAIERWMSAQQKKINTKKLFRDEKDVTPIEEEKSLQKFNLLRTRKQIIDEMTKQKIALKSARVDAVRVTSKLDGVNNLLKNLDYKNVLLTEQSALQKELDTWIKIQDPLNIQRAVEYKALLTLVQQARDNIKNYVPAIGATTAEIEQAQKELDHKFNTAVETLQAYTRFCEQALSEIGMTMGQLPKTAKVLWRRARLAEKLLKNDFHPELLLEVRAKVLIQRLKIAGFTPAALEKALTAYLDENEKYKTRLQVDATADAIEVTKRYQELSKICEDCFYPLIRKFTRKRNWLRKKPEDKIDPLWDAADSEIHNALKSNSESQDIANTLRDYYLTKKLAGNDNQWHEDFTDAEENLDKIRNKHGLAVDIFLKRFPDVTKVNKAIALVSKENELQEVILQHNIIANKLRAIVSLGADVPMVIITTFDSAIEKILKAKRSLADAISLSNPEAIKEAKFDLIREIFDYLKFAAENEDLIRKYSPNLTKLQNRQMDAKRAPNENVNMAVNSWKTADILATVLSEYKKPTLSPMSYQVDYLLAQIKSLDAKEIEDDAKKIATTVFDAKLLGDFNGQFNFSPIALLEAISGKLRDAENSIAWKVFGYFGKTSSHKRALQELDMARIFAIKLINQTCKQCMHGKKDLPVGLPAIVVADVILPAMKKPVVDHAPPEELEPLLPKPAPATNPSWFGSLIASIQKWWKGSSKTVPATSTPSGLTTPVSPKPMSPKPVVVGSSSTSGGMLASMSKWMSETFSKDKKTHAVTKPPIKNNYSLLSTPKTPSHHDLHAHPEKFFLEANNSVYQLEETTALLPIAEFDAFTKQHVAPAGSALASLSMKAPLKAVPSLPIDENHFQAHSFEVKNHHEIKWVERIDSTKNMVSEVYVIPEEMRIENIFKKCVRENYLTQDKHAIDAHHDINAVLDQCVQYLTRDQVGLITKENLLKILNQYQDIIDTLIQQKGYTFRASSKVDKLATELVKAYQMVSEQTYGIPYLGKCQSGEDIIMRHAPCHLPSDTLLSLAIREVNSFVKAQKDAGTQKALLLSRAWDPAYVKAIMLACDLRNRYEPADKKIKYINVTGYPIPVIAEAEITAFEWCLTERAGAKHDLTELGKKLAKQKQISSPLSELGADYPKNLLKV